MPNLDERVAYLEGRMEDNNRMFADLRATMTELRTDIAAFRIEMRTDMAAFRSEMRGDIAGLRADMGGLRTEIKADIAELRTDLRATDAKVDRRFVWLAGAHITTLLAIIGALLVPVLPVRLKPDTTYSERADLSAYAPGASA